MVVLSPRFALLASLCAIIAVAIPPRVEAARVNAGHPSDKQLSSPRSYPRVSSTSFLGRQGTIHEQAENDEQHGGPPRHHSPGLPPLLRRHIVPDHAKEGHHHHDHKTSGSVFARSRYRQGPATRYRRSSFYVPGEQGDVYLISGNLPKDGKKDDSSTGKLRRQLDESDLALGRIDIIDTSGSPPGTRRLASLTVNSTPVDWASGQTSAKAFQLNASTTNQTQFIMMPLGSDGGFNRHVTLATEVFDANSATMVMYCATYDPDPGATSALLMTPCTTQPTQASDANDPCSGQENDASPNPHESQIFAYDPSTGKIEPMSIIAGSLDTEGNDNNSDLGPCSAAKSVGRRDSISSTTSNSAKPSSTSTSIAPSASALQQARNVTLVYVTGALEVPADASPGTSSNTLNANASQAPAPAPASAAVVTTTITTTVLSTATALGSGSQPLSSRTVSPAQAAVSVSISSQLSSSSATTIVPKPSASGTPAHPNSANPTSSVPKPPAAAASSKAPANAVESFEVDIVGIAASTTSGASLTTTATASHSPTSASLNPQAVASSVAKQAASRRYVIASASVV